MTNKTNLSPWAWIPTLYFAEGIPYFLVNNISVVMFTKMGVPNGQMALFTSLLYLPWVIKPLWSPFIDIIKTKRWWIIAMQILMAAAMILLTLSIPHPDVATIKSGGTPISLFYISLLLFIITAFASATHDIAADGFYMLALTQSKQSAFIGIRSVFYRLSNVFCNSAIVFVAGWFESHGEDIPTSWQYTMLITALLFSGLAVWHTFFIPKPTSDHSSIGNEKPSAKKIMYEFGRTFVSYFKKPGVWLAIIFMLLYRLPEAFLLKMVAPFLLGAPEQGGMGLSQETYGLVYGLIGVLFLLLGGVLGGLFASRVGLKKSIWWMAASMTLPCLSFVYLGIFMPTNILAIAVAIAIEQFGYGFGFTAYMLYMMYFSEGELKTSHYAICTAFMAASMMIPGMFAGYLQELLGYTDFFWMVIVCCAATLIITYFVDRRIDPEYGRK